GAHARCARDKARPAHELRLPGGPSALRRFDLQIRSATLEANCQTLTRFWRHTLKSLQSLRRLLDVKARTTSSSVLALVTDSTNASALIPASPKKRRSSGHG